MDISVIGCGNMGGAIASALRDSGKYTLHVYDSDKSKAEKKGFTCTASLEEAIKAADIVILAVKPQVVTALYDTLSEYNDKSYISILAGVPLEVLEYKIDADNIARFMPNLAAGARQAVTAIALSKSADESFSKAAFEIASAFGSAFLLDEALFPAFIGLSGSGIAFAMQFIHAMSMAGVEEGLPYPEALAIAADTMLSACSLLKQTKANPVELASRVCSAGGTTIKGMNALSANSFDHAVIEAVKAASLRSRELEHIALERKND